MIATRAGHSRKTGGTGRALLEDSDPGTEARSCEGGSAMRIVTILIATGMLASACADRSAPPSPGDRAAYGDPVEPRSLYPNPRLVTVVDGARAAPAPVVRRVPSQPPLAVLFDPPPPVAPLDPPLPRTRIGQPARTVPPAAASADRAGRSVAEAGADPRPPALAPPEARSDIVDLVGRGDDEADAPPPRRSAASLAPQRAPSPIPRPLGAAARPEASEVAALAPVPAAPVVIGTAPTIRSTGPASLIAPQGVRDSAPEGLPALVQGGSAPLTIQ